MSDAPERALLESKSREELVAIADAAGVSVPARARKALIVDAILGEPGESSASGDAATKSESNDEPAAAEAAASDGTRVRRVRRTTNESDHSADHGEDTADDEVEAEAAAGDADAADADAADANKANGGQRSGGGTDRSRDGKGQGGDDEPGVAEPGNRRRRRRGRDRAREEQWQGEPVECSGVLDLRDEGYGFLRTRGVLPSNDDVYVAAKQVRQFGLRRGDRVTGASRPAARNEKNPALMRIDSVNDGALEAAAGRPVFDELTPLFPDERIRLERTEQPWDLTPRVVDLLSPIGRGQRGLIVSPPKAGKTRIMKEFARSIEANHDDIHLIVLLVDERPEEVTDMKRSISGEVLASTFDRPVDEHIAVAELTLERAKRMVESGRDVVVLLDGITRLARAYNMAAPGTGRMMSGGVDAGALYPPKKFFGAARNLEEGGSLTIIATALVETGSRMDEVIFEEFKGTGNMELRLDRRLAERGIFPAIDVGRSSTRQAELLMDRKRVDQLGKLRRVLQGLADDEGAQPGAGLELLLERLGSMKTNDDLLDEIGSARA